MRDPTATRAALLAAAYDEMSLKGFQAASVDAIIAQAGVTKGALYHHFGSKRELGWAVVDEIIREHFEARWVAPLQASDDPFEGLERVLQGLEQGLTPEKLQRGCPILGFAQEMSPLDEGFRERIASIFDDWRGAIAAALRRGQETGAVRADVDPDAVAAFTVAVHEGSMGLLKNAQDPEPFARNYRTLRTYLSGLRATDRPASA